jgi:hypothetical protein
MTQRPGTPRNVSIADGIQPLYGISPLEGIGTARNSQG